MLSTKTLAEAALAPYTSSMIYRCYTRLSVDENMTWDSPYSQRDLHSFISLRGVIHHAVLLRCTTGKPLLPPSSILYTCVKDKVHTMFTLNSSLNLSQQGGYSINHVKNTTKKTAQHLLKKPLQQHWPINRGILAALVVSLTRRSLYLHILFVIRLVSQFLLLDPTIACLNMKRKWS